MSEYLRDSIVMPGGAVPMICREPMPYWRHNLELLDSLMPLIALQCDNPMNGKPFGVADFTAGPKSV